MPAASTTTSSTPISYQPLPYPSGTGGTIPIKVETKNVSTFSKPITSRISSIDSDMPDISAVNPNNVRQSAASSSMAIVIDGSEEDAVLARSQFLTKEEVLRRRARRVKQLAKIYRDYYWVLMEELKLKYREYYWEYGKSPFQEDNNEEDHSNSNRVDLGCRENNNNNSNNNNSNRCGVHGCKSKAMALTRFCHMHILSDAKQKLYKACTYVIKSSPTGPILCGKPILRSTVPSLCSPHFQKAEKHVARALKKAGLNVPSPNKVAPKFHVILAEYVNQIQDLRRAAKRVASHNVEVKEEN